MLPTEIAGQGQEVQNAAQSETQTQAPIQPGARVSSNSQIFSIIRDLRVSNFDLFLYRAPPPIPRDLDSRTTITIGEQTFDIDADDLESICVLGRGAYGVVEKMKHKQTDTILAVKVRFPKDPRCIFCY